MSKRLADKDLNSDNWQDEDSDEDNETGVFKPAPSDVLKNRVIKKAKRKIDNSSSGLDSSSKKPFQNFSFLVSSTSSSLLPINDKQAANNTADSNSTVSFGSDNKLNSVFNKPTISDSKNKEITGSTQGCSSLDNSKYSEIVRRLNESVCKWIKTHVDSDPYCILSPVFADYEKHLTKINEDFPVVESSANLLPETNVKFSFGIPNVSIKAKTMDNTNIKDTKEKDNLSSSVIGVTNLSSSQFSLATNTSKSAAPFIFGSSLGFNPISTVGATFGSSFGSGGFGKGFFSNPTTISSIEKSNEEKKDENDEDYVPPKVEIVDNKEEGAFYSIRCKLYYNNDEQFKERGLGFLHLKTNGDKTQIVVRTDTSLGNILLNINLAKSIPIKRHGVNNVSLICVANPPIDPKKPRTEPVPMLIRVKTKEDADELFKKLTECQDKL